MNDGFAEYGPLLPDWLQIRSTPRTSPRASGAGCPVREVSVRA
jgi:hypothetical protein